jgi:hypothetical protein
MARIKKVPLVTEIVSEVPLVTETIKVHEERKISREHILSSAARACKVIGTMQENLHSTVLLPAVLHAWKWKEADLIGHVLNSLNTQNKSLRIESIAYWFQEWAGFKVTYKQSENVFSTSSNFAGKSKAELHHSFSYDKEHAAVLRDTKNRYWKVAPVEIKLLKAPEIAKATESYEKSLAKAILLGADMETVNLEVQAIIANALKYTKDKTIIKWFEEYNSPEQIELRKEAA